MLVMPHSLQPKIFKSELASAKAKSIVTASVRIG